MRKVIITCDPGIDGTGLAIWDAKKFYRKDLTIPPREVRTIYPRKCSNWLERVSSLCDYTEREFARFEVLQFHCEFPQFFGSVKGRAAIVTKSRDGTPEPGDVFKLCFLVGAFGQLCHSLTIPFFPILVNDWKGQLEKRIVQDRLHEYIPTLDQLGIRTSHGYDAVGIGVHVRGFEV